MGQGLNNTIDYSEYTLSQEDMDYIESVLENDLIKCGIHSALVIDLAGNIVAKKDNGNCNHDLYSFAALASANYAAVDTMAKIVGEEEFSLLFHKGKGESTHFTKVNDEYLLVTIFGSELSLGWLRLKIADAAGKIQSIWTR